MYESNDDVTKYFYSDIIYSPDIVKC